MACISGRVLDIQRPGNRRAWGKHSASRQTPSLPVDLTGLGRVLYVEKINVSPIHCFRVVILSEELAVQLTKSRGVTMLKRVVRTNCHGRGKGIPYEGHRVPPCKESMEARL